MEREYSMAPPAAFVEVLRAREEGLVQWLESRPNPTFSASDFKLHEDLGIGYAPIESEAEFDEENDENQVVGAEVDQEGGNVGAAIEDQTGEGGNP
ncbi:unnamed protein product [Cochlearia groenlandica]